MSSPVYELLKRPDELFVVEHAHLQPRFVEDSVRLALRRRSTPTPSSTTATSSSRARSTSRRSTATTCSPSATAPSASCAPSSSRAQRPERHTELQAWLADDPDHGAHRRGPGSSLGAPWNVIVLNDNHNTFEGVAAALSRILPGVSFDQGLRIADTIHTTGRAIVWSGHRERGRAVLDGLKQRGLTMAPLEQ